MVEAIKSVATAKIRMSTCPCTRAVLRKVGHLLAPKQASRTTLEVALSIILSRKNISTKWETLTVLTRLGPGR